MGVNKKCLVVLMGAIFPLLGYSASAEKSWIGLATSDDGTKWEAKTGSFEFSKNKSGVPIAVIAGRMVSTKPTKIDLNKWYVSAGDCKSKMGKLITLSVSGEYKFENDFLFESGNVASSIAKFICDVADQAIKNADGKSL
ncbi:MULTISPECIES: hypothetical protein [Pseudomonas]|jgi:hypothetical protein|uniref:hypothetical protein n=1 Tax=Pseudomonas TaxID=286 RepID=UPI000A1F1920|nr:MULTISPECIES: hypothetical protein [Pseudomonas]AWA38377.1 hypothetical protein DBV33_07155 [Pseudomonas fluorescens]